MKGGMNMLRCFMDPTISEESRCSKCCIHCEYRESCDYCCQGIEEWKTEEKIAKNCIECVDA